MIGESRRKDDRIDARTLARLATLVTILSEAGWDMSKWETGNHFVSWLRLRPDNRISGEKIIGKRRLPTNNRIHIALKIAASSLTTSKGRL